jgi:hypothetical protein
MNLKDILAETFRRQSRNCRVASFLISSIPTATRLERVSSPTTRSGGFLSLAIQILQPGLKEPI